MVPVALLRETAARLPQARLEVLTGCGHFKHIEIPAEVAELLSEFLTDRETGRKKAGAHV